MRLQADIQLSYYACRSLPDVQLWFIAGAINVPITVDSPFPLASHFDVSINAVRVRHATVRLVE